MDDQALLRNCRRGDELAWEMLVRRYQGRIYGIAWHYVGDAEEARDLAQDIFVRIYNRLETCTESETFVPWMLRIARNACIDRLRRMKARPARPLASDDTIQIRGPGPDPAEEYRRNARRDLVHAALGRLGGISREVLLLREIQGLSVEEVSGLLGVPIGTVKSRASRARLELARAVITLRGGRRLEDGD